MTTQGKQTVDTGIISRVVLDRGFGFIERPNGQPDCFFHMRDCDEALGWDPTLEERRVQFTPERTSKGWRARSVRPTD